MKKYYFAHKTISTQELNLIIWIYMTDNEFNLEFNKKLLYYRENVIATVYINI